MMKYTYIVLVALLSLSCSAQNIVPIYDGPLDTPSNPYYKDVDNDFNPFVGVWKWEDGDSSWTIQFEKIEMVPSGNAFDDVLIGEYQYIEDGVELINELPLVPHAIDDLDSHNLWGAVITTKNRDFPPCDECAPNTRFIIVFMEDPIRPGIKSYITFARFIENGVEKMRLRNRITANTNYLDDPDYDGPDVQNVPEGVYTFVKQ